MSSKITKTKSGKWHTKVFLYKDENGKMIFKSITADTKVQCQVLAAEALKNREEKPKTVHYKTVRQVVDKYAELIEPTHSRGHFQNCDTAKKGLPNVMSLEIDGIDNIKVQEAINRDAAIPTIKGTPLATSTLRQYWRITNAALRSVCNIQLKVKFKRSPKKKDKLPDNDEIERVITGDRFELAYRLSYEMGLRTEEVCGLRYEDIENGIAHINIVKDYDGYTHIPKNDTSIREIPITPNVMRLIKETDAWKNQTGFFIEGSSKSLYRHFKMLMPDMTLHKLRHAWLTTLIRLGVGIKVCQVLGGWSNPDVPMKIYLEYTDDELQDAIEKINNYFTKSS